MARRSVNTFFSGQVLSWTAGTDIPSEQNSADLEEVGPPTNRRATL